MKMKRKVIRVCSLVLLSVAVSTALGGCGSKSEKDTAASSTPSTSQLVKSSTRSTVKKTDKQAKSDASASKKDQDQEASVTESSSGKKQAATDDAAQSGTSSSAASDSNKYSQTTGDSQSDAPVPAALVGTWTGTSPQATDISFTVDADGNVTSKANFNVDYEPYRQS